MTKYQASISWAKIALCATVFLPRLLQGTEIAPNWHIYEKAFERFGTSTEEIKAQIRQLDTDEFKAAAEELPGQLSSIGKNCSPEQAMDKINRVAPEGKEHAWRDLYILGVIKLNAQELKARQGKQLPKQ